ncbi:unnamed protein product [Paramecium octaurelia]|uniref:Uncharacterized protein n=1 Tax=Paramecium octaurelia TaxID=43137 RepID=A0A8S1XZ45_PAROT|nr:unnamed protein product [Paramecium octaurelia]
MISFLKISFLKSIIYENCLTGTQLIVDIRIFKSLGQVLRLQIDVETKHYLIELKVGIWKLDSWDKEGLEIHTNDVQIENLKLDYHDGTMICRNEMWEDLLQPLSLRFQITGTDLKIKLKDNLQNNSESWGFRDFILRLTIPCVNFYSECNYLGTLFQICQGEKSKLQNEIPSKIKSILMGPEIIVKLINYFAGVIQEFTSSQPCLNVYHFPKVNYENDQKQIKTNIIQSLQILFQCIFYKYDLNLPEFSFSMIEVQFKPHWKLKKNNINCIFNKSIFNNQIMNLMQFLEQSFLFFGLAPFIIYKTSNAQ